MGVSLYSAKELTEFPLEEVTEIFFSAATIKEFKSIEEREKFFYRWCGQYLEEYPDNFLVAMEKEKVLGYSCSHPDSKKALEEFGIPGQSFFTHLFDEYPLHLHINCHEDSRGKGVGRLLIDRQSQLSDTGIHVITEKEADNCGFYRALGFDREEEADFKGHSLLFMGKKTN